MYAAAGAVIEAAGRQAVGGDDPAADLRAARHERYDRDRGHARGAANVAAPHDIVGGQVRVIENMSVDPVALGRQRVVERVATWRSGCSFCSTAVASAARAASG